MDNGLFYVGTDGNGDWVEDCYFEWPYSGIAELVKYDGDNPNTHHSPSHRLEHQVPEIISRLDKQPLFISEWWVAFDEDRFDRNYEISRTSSRRNDDESRFCTLVHYNKTDRFLKGALSALRLTAGNAPPLRGPIQWPEIKELPDLPGSPLGREFIIETIFPYRFDPASEYTRPGDQWDRASKQALYVNSHLGAAIKHFD